MKERIAGGVERARQALRELARQFDAGGRTPEQVRAVDTLSAALEELEVAAEELHQQNEELIAAREQLALEQQSYRELFELMPDPYLATDLNGVIRQANRAARGLFGIGSGRLEGKPLAVFVERSSRPQFTTRLVDLQGHWQARDWEFDVRDRSGRPVRVSADIAPSEGTGQRVTGLRWVLRDVTAAARARTALQRAFSSTTDERDQLRDVDRWKDAFLAAAAHDLRTPLSATRMWAERILSRPDRPDEVEGFARRIIERTTWLDTLLSDLLDLDRLTRGGVTAERRTVDVSTIVADVVDGMQQQTHPVQVDARPSVVDVDPVRVSQIIRNLVENAVVHTPSGTPIRVRATPDGDGVTIIVEDDGPGVPQEVRDDLLLPFVRSSAHADDAGGAGIGLSLVDLFAELHGGTVRVESTASGGARFVVELPGLPGA